MQFGMLGHVGQGNMHYTGCRCPHMKGHFCGVWPIEKIRSGVGKNLSSNVHYEISCLTARSRYEVIKFITKVT